MEPRSKIAYLPWMRKFNFLIACATLLSVTELVTAGPIRDTAALRREIMAVYARQPQAEFALAFEDLSTGQQFFFNEHESFHAASTMKTPVLIETFRLIAAHKLSLDDSILVHTDFISIADSSRFQLDSADDSEKDLYGLAGRRLALRQLLYKMITESSNLATNLVIELVGAKGVMATMREMGANDIRVLRGVEDNKAFQKGMNNTTTAFDLMHLFSRIAEGTAVDSPSSQAMIRILLDQHFKEVIAGKLPDKVRVASKSGWITGSVHDSGIVFLPDGRKYVIVLLSRGIPDAAIARELGATVSKIIYDHMVEGPPPGQADIGDIEGYFPVIGSMYKSYAEKNHFPGMTFGIVADGKLVYSGGTGTGNIADRVPVSPATDFRIASMTKSFISVGILQLRDAGKLKLDDPASMYIPELRGQKGPSSDAPAITIRHLLTHSAGFPEDNPWGDRQLANSDEQLLALVRKGLSFSNSPGIGYEYSNTGFALLGYILQKVSGQQYADYVTEHILKPLGMTHTYFEYSRVPSGALAHGYRWLGGEWVEQPMLHDGAFGAMGGMITTMEDFAKYEAFQLDAWPSRSGPEGAILKRSSRREMQQPWTFNNLNPSFSYSGPGGSACPMTSAYAYGIRWTKDCKGRTMVGHTGGLPGFGSNWMILPDYGIGVICFANLTYANTSAINLRVLDTLVTLARLKPREGTASAILLQRQRELAAFLPEWNGARESPVFAVNFWEDYFVDSLRAEARALFEEMGAVRRVGPMHAENGLRGWFLLEGERGDLEVRFTLTPENPAKVQEFHLRRVREN
jgi:CubicO group peptidase (beta-lactamase class C family)/beta-lactamase class A